MNNSLVLTFIKVAFFVVFGVTSVQSSSIDFTLDELIADGRLACETEFSLELDAVVQFDFDDDDQFDLAVLDEAEFTCEGSASTYCGSGGCTVHFITPVDYISGQVRNWQLVRTWAYKPVIFLDLHGQSCDESGATPCYDVFSIYNGRFITKAR